MILMLLQLKGQNHSVLIYKCMQISFHALKNENALIISSK